MESIYAPNKEIFFKPELWTLLKTLFTKLISNTTSKKIKWFSIMGSVCRIYLRKAQYNCSEIKNKYNRTTISDLKPVYWRYFNRLFVPSVNWLSNKTGQIFVSKSQFRRVLKLSKINNKGQLLHISLETLLATLCFNPLVLISAASS